MSGEDSPVTVDWVEKKLAELEEDASEIWSVQPSVVNSFNEWSAIKLIALSGVVDIYTSIIPKYFDNYYYIDALAGSGIASISDDERFVGSPIIATAMAHDPFDHYFLIEMDDKKADALRNRMNFLADNFDYGFSADDFTVLNEDANSAIPDIIDSLREVILKEGSVHLLSFIDNEGADITWKTVKKLSTVYSDLLVNFPASQLRRMAGVPTKTALNEFFGSKGWESAGTKSEDLRTIYKARLSDINRGVQTNFRVEGSKNYHYDVIYAARETKGGNKYMEAFDYFEEKLDELHGDDIDLVLRYMSGEAVDFAPFPGPDPNQTGLDDFD